MVLAACCSPTAAGRLPFCHNWTLCQWPGGANACKASRGTARCLCIPISRLGQARVCDSAAGLTDVMVCCPGTRQHAPTVTYDGVTCDMTVGSGKLLGSTDVRSWCRVDVRARPSGIPLSTTALSSRASLVLLNNGTLNALTQQSNATATTSQLPGNLLGTSKRVAWKESFLQK